MQNVTLIAEYDELVILEDAQGRFALTAESSDPIDLGSDPLPSKLHFTGAYPNNLDDQVCV